MSYSYLLIGDVHCTVAEIPDCKKLLDYIYDIIKKTSHCVPVFTGDLYDHHAIIRAEVQEFWYNELNRLDFGSIKPIIIMGNHDRSNNKASTASALLAHVEQANIAFPNNPHGDGNIAFFSFYDDNEKMVRMANSSPWRDHKYLICHATFKGAQYDNGHFAPDGVDQERFPQEKIIAGHLHTAKQLGKVLYIGSPRWRNISDATMEERYLYLVDEDLNCIKKYPTSPVCSRIHRLQDTQESPLSSQVFIEKDRYHIDIKGDREFTLNRKSLYPNCKVSVCETKVQPTAILSTQDPLPVSLNKWLNQFNPKNTYNEDFKNKIKQDPFFKSKL